MTDTYRDEVAFRSEDLDTVRITMEVKGKVNILDMERLMRDAFGILYDRYRYSRGRDSEWSLIMLDEVPGDPTFSVPTRGEVAQLKEQLGREM